MLLWKMTCGVNMTALKTVDSIKDKLVRLLGKDAVLSDFEDIYAYAHDNNCKTDMSQRPFAVVLPSKNEQVCEVVKLCNENNIPVIARGAGTNHVGGCVASQGGILIHFSRMNKILEISRENLNMKVQPGATVGEIQRIAQENGLFYPPDPSNLKVSTIGGALALSSGGPRGLKYGTAKDYVLNLKVVLADGTLINTGSDCSKSVAGYNLTQLFVGSEGTLGIIVEATLKLIPKPQASKILLVYFDTIESASSAVNKILESGITPAVVDLLDRFTLQTIEDFMPSGLKTDNEAMLFIELDGSEREIEEQENFIAGLLNYAEIQRITSPEQAEIFWTARRASFGATSRLKGNVITEDVVVPRTNIPALVSGIKEINKKYGLTACIMGHAGDGNIHPNYALDFDDFDEMSRFYKAKDELFSLALSLGGTISGEHGIGFEKSCYLKNAIGERVYGISKQLKAIFDPKNIMNPGKLFTE